MGVPVRRITCTWCLVARLEFAPYLYFGLRICTWVALIPLGHLQFASGPRAISPAQMTDRMEVEPSLTLSNDLKRACELLERCDIIYLIIQLSYHQHTIFIQSDANVNTNTSANTNIYHSAKA